MKVTVLVAAYNAARFLPRCLDSLEAQTYTDVEVIVIDDASNDDTALVASRYPFVRLLRLTENSGQAVARNEGLRLATGSLITMLDADDWLSPDALQQAVEAIRDDVDCVLFRLIKVFNDGTETEYGIPAGPWTGHDAFYLSLDWTLHGLYVARAELYHRFPFDTATRLFSDDNTTRLHFFSSRRVVACSGCYYYRQHDQSMTNSHTLLRFDYLEANLSMRRWLDRIGASHDAIMHYESHRWLNYIGMHWYQWQHRFPAAEVAPRLHTIYSTFRCADIPVSVRSKFGYRYMNSYRLFTMQLWLYFTLRTVRDKLARM